MTTAYPKRSFVVDSLGKESDRWLDDSAIEEILKGMDYDEEVVEMFRECLTGYGENATERIKQMNLFLEKINCGFRMTHCDIANNGDELTWRVMPV